MTTLIGLISVLIAIVSYSLYFRDIFKRKTKPHAISWLVWGTLNTVICIQQLAHGAGPGAWVTGVAAFADFAIFLSAFKYGEKKITRLDWMCLAVAMVVLVLWGQDSNDIFTVILACTIFIVGMIPTFRKSLKNAHEETAITFALNGTKFFLALFALNTFTLNTALYPITLFLINGIFAVFLITRQLTTRGTPVKRTR
ncbi:MAG: hypothetical protein ABIP50_03365 [Candidatus Saccharimonadales bacterium]